MGVTPKGVGLSAQTNRLRRYSLLSLTRFTSLRNAFRRHPR
nr:MAG TPA: hypothetical protein [Microviridae sp.]